MYAANIFCAQNQRMLLKLEEAAKHSLLTEEQKVYFLTRYVVLVQHYRKKYYRVNFMYNFLRISVMVGSIFIPALLTLQKDPETIISLTTYWVVFALSLQVTLSNSLLELFNVAALNAKYWLHVQKLETEGWHFLNLTDSYSKYKSLGDAYRKFTSRVEKLHLSLVFDLLRLENKNKTSTKQDGNGNEAASMNEASSVNTDLSRAVRATSQDTASTGSGSRGSFSPKISTSATNALFNALNQPDAASHDDSYDNGEEKLAESKPSMLVSLHEFQSRLGLDHKQV